MRERHTWCRYQVPGASSWNTFMYSFFGLFSFLSDVESGRSRCSRRPEHDFGLRAEIGRMGWEGLPVERGHVLYQVPVALDLRGKRRRLIVTANAALLSVSSTDLNMPISSCSLFFGTLLKNVSLLPLSYTMMCNIHIHVYEMKISALLLLRLAPCCVTYIKCLCIITEYKATNGFRSEFIQSCSPLGVPREAHICECDVGRDRDLLASRVGKGAVAVGTVQDEGRGGRGGGRTTTLRTATAGGKVSS